MAMSAATVWEVRQGGSDTNGGGFVTGTSGTDWSQQSAPQYAVADGVTAGTTTITSATAAFGADVVGNLIYVQGGTGAVVAGWYQITLRNSATSITVDRSTGLTAGTGVTLHIGGALASPGQAAALLTTSGMHAWVKYSASVYGLTTATAGAAGPASLASSVACVLEGYDQVRGDRTANRPTLQWQVSPGANTYAITAVGTSRQLVANIRVNGNSQANGSGISVAAARTGAVNCAVANCSQAGTVGYLNTSGAGCVRCQASACVTGFSGGAAFECDATACTTVGFGGAIYNAVHCLARGCATGFSSSATVAAIVACTADANTSIGFDVSSAYSQLAGCLASNQSGGGAIGFKVGTNVATLSGCAAYNNATHVSGTPLLCDGPFALAASPWLTASAPTPTSARRPPTSAPMRTTPGAPSSAGPAMASTARRTTRIPGPCSTPTRPAAGRRPRPRSGWEADPCS